MTFPVTSSSAFAGTAFSFNGDNVCIRNSIIMGFNQAIASVNCDRGLIENVCFDNINNISIQNSGDTWKVRHCHAWPFAADYPTQSSLNRSGTNFYIANSNDACMVSHCFSYGYANNFYASSAGAITFTDCDADGDSLTASNGFVITGSTANSRAQLLSCQVYGQTNSVYIGLTSGTNSVVKIIGGTFDGNTYGVNIATGSAAAVMLYDSEISANTYAVLINSAATVLDINGCNLSGNTNFVYSSVNTENVNFGPNNRWGFLGAGADGVSLGSTQNFLLWTITPSGSVCSLPPFGDVYWVSAGNFGTLGGGTTGRRVTLIFNGTCAVYSSSGSYSAMALTGSATFNAVGGCTLTLVHSGSQWYEVSRMVF
jgi:hypothetical protein